MVRTMWLFLVIALGLTLPNLRGAGPEPASLKMREQLAKASNEAIADPTRSLKAQRFFKNPGIIYPTERYW